MPADQAEILREEARAPHAVFHQFLLLLGKAAQDCHFFFFEGSEDPAFYIGFLLKRLDGREYHEFVCNGRQGALKVNELCSRDGRATDRVMYFIDKDHCDIMNPEESLPSRVFQTDCYSFENYLVCKQSFRRFWSERLRLHSGDPRYEAYLSLFERVHVSFMSRMHILMAIVLLGRGIDNRPVAKLNLNNVNLERVISLDLTAGKVRWASNGGKNFLASSNMTASGITVRGDAIRSVLRSHLRGRDVKSFVRGKYELWFFVRFLSLITRDLSDRARAKATGLPRATPGEFITHTGAIDSLCGLTPCPTTLLQFLEARIPPRQQVGEGAIANA